MANPASDYYDRKQEALLAVQAEKEQRDPERVQKAKEFQKMKEAYFWYYERAW